MKNSTRKIALGLVMALSLGVLAGCGNTEKIGYVNLAQIEQDSSKYEEIQNKITDKQNEIAARLEKAQKEDSQEEFNKKLQKSQEEMQIFKLAMERELKTNIDVAVADIAREKKLTIVVDKYAELSGGEDITSQVLDKLGRKTDKKDVAKKETNKNAASQTEEQKK